MNILILGSGGREHALAWKCKQSPRVEKLFVAPGNPGTAQGVENIDLDLGNHASVADFCVQQKIDLVIVGPDNLLADGIVDYLQSKNIRVFGPTKRASQIEWSKSFAKQFMAEEGIPTAACQIFTKYEKAKSYIQTQKFPLVIKASGLAFGKGVSIVQNEKEALEVLDSCMNEKIFGDAGNEIVIEEFLDGQEISIHAFSDGESIILFPPAQDHKRIHENDQGPNTGGMGTIVPVPWVTESLMVEIKDKVVIPTIRGLAKGGREFRGVLFPGIMVTGDGIRVLEFNARFGDPETQSFMRLLDSDIINVIESCIDGKLSKTNIQWKSGYACCVVAAAENYPEETRKGDEITGIRDAEKNSDTVVFHAGTKALGKKIVTAGGRVLGVTATGTTLESALSSAYKSLEKISFLGMQYRKDIGKKSIR
ncbi:MAG: phosphoribosylamine--glycine ligase [Patescibacteria group bacterium]